MRSLNTDGSGAWQTYGQRDTINRTYGSHALYDVGKILVPAAAASSADARVIDINGATPQVSQTTRMASGRRQHNLTVLADGSVLATGGNSSGAQLVDLGRGVYTAERWDPATGTWSTLAAEQVTRQYHSTALLLPDGRVLSSGGGICGDCAEVGYLAKNAQVFTPPYLFKRDGSGELAPRPVISGAPTSANYGAPLRDRHAAGRLDSQGRAGSPGRGDALGEHGAALRAARVQRGVRLRSPRRRRRAPTSLRRASTCSS